MMVATISPESLSELFRASMRIAAASVSIVTARDANGRHYGMAVTSATSLSMSPPSMMVAINRSASIHPVIVETGKFCLNLMGEAHHEILERFSRSDLRDSRFSQEHWQEGPDGLPVLRGALSSQICTVEAAHDYSTHTIFIGRVDHVLLPAQGDETAAPLIWMNGTRKSLATGFPAKS